MNPVRSRAGRAGGAVLAAAGLLSVQALVTAPGATAAVSGSVSVALAGRVVHGHDVRASSAAACPAGSEYVRVDSANPAGVVDGSDTARLDADRTWTLVLRASSRVADPENSGFAAGRWTYRAWCGRAGSGVHLHDYPPFTVDFTAGIPLRVRTSGQTATIGAAQACPNTGASAVRGQARGEATTAGWSGTFTAAVGPGASWQFTTGRHSAPITSATATCLPADPGGLAFSYLPWRSAPTTAVVAMGDSYSSGEGTSSFDPGTNGPVNFCHRSRYAWPRLLDQELARLTLTAHLACSGAETVHVDNPQDAGQYASPDAAPDHVSQLRRLREVIARSGTPRVVTLGIGGNDVGFRELLEACGVPDCVRNGALAQVRSRIGSAAFRDQLRRTYAAVREAAPGARVVVVGYPNIFPPNGKTDHGLLCAPFTEAEIRGLVDVARTLEAALVEVSAQARVEFNSTFGVLRDHELCSASPYVYPLTPVGGNLRGHPTAAGQRLMAFDVRDYLGGS
ncbi:SGNH/GDSL hydrolase family protein [Kineococcus glutinatus]|uniref:SGNH hydrolase-type esterase domain-containing protein n=1 Tax=Kineococcus glutinatus TaxID=1070872 RepID=A0ABP9I017_9ACTN